MFYRVTRYGFAPEDYDAILALANSRTDELRAIAGLMFVDTFIAGEGEAVIVAAYENEDAFSAASETIMSILGEMAQLMTGAPMTSSGTVDWTTRG